MQLDKIGGSVPQSTVSLQRQRRIRDL